VVKGGRIDADEADGVVIIVVELVAVGVEVELFWLGQRSDLVGGRNAVYCDSKLVSSWAKRG